MKKTLIALVILVITVCSMVSASAEPVVYDWTQFAIGSQPVNPERLVWPLCQEDQSLEEFIEDFPNACAFNPNMQVMGSKLYVYLARKEVHVLPIIDGKIPAEAILAIRSVGSRSYSDGGEFQPIEWVEEVSLNLAPLNVDTAILSAEGYEHQLYIQNTENEELWFLDEELGYRVNIMLLNQFIYDAEWQD